MRQNLQRQSDSIGSEGSPQPQETGLHFFSAPPPNPLRIQNTGIYTYLLLALNSLPSFLAGRPRPFPPKAGLAPCAAGNFSWRRRRVGPAS